MAKKSTPEGIAPPRTHADKVADREAGQFTSGNPKSNGQGDPTGANTFATGRNSSGKKTGSVIEHPDGDFVAE